MAACRNRFVALLLGSLCAALAMAAHPRAQQTGIVGLVTDRCGSSLPGVTVTASGRSSRAIAYTDGDGRFAIGSVPPGTYSLVASIPGFEGEPAG